MLPRYELKRQPPETLDSTGGTDIATANLLSTNTVNFQDLIGNGRSYVVPPYQRDYSWTEEEWEDLWLDIEEQCSSPDSRHYMGAVVVKAETDRRSTIIDGQQRIATLTILGLAIIKCLESTGDETNRERAKALRNRFIGERDPASLMEISKLQLNSHDDGFFQDYLVQLRDPLNPRSLPKSNRLLWDCFRYFERQLEVKFGLLDDGQQIAELLSEVVARRLLFILITVDDEISAYTVFETLNARGLELTTTDLLKNYLFSRLRAPSDLEAAQRRWQRLVTTVRQDRFGEFLRYHYLTKHRKIRTGRLFKLVRDEVRDSGAVLSLLDDLERRAELFDALFDPTHSFWTDRPEVKAFLRELSLFRVKQMTPLLFAAYEKLSPDEFAKTLKCVSTISFRYTVISGLNTNELEPIYSDAARAVLDGSAATARAIFEWLKPIYVSDDKFQSDFAQRSVVTSGQRKKLAKYILCRLEADAGPRDIDFETDAATIEHILPENAVESWDESFPPEKQAEFIYRLGNLTLLRASINRDLANVSYEHKVLAYRDSEFSITKAIPDIAPQEWTPALLEQRQDDMAARARHIWRSDFA